MLLRRGRKIDFYRALTTLDLSDNSLTSLPDSWGGLSSLTSLDLSVCLLFHGFSLTTVEKSA